MHDGRDNGLPNLRLVPAERTPAHLPASAARAEDVALAQAVLEGDRRVLGGFVRANAAKVFALARRYARAPQDACDVAQEAFRRAIAAARRALRKDPQRAIPLDRWLLRTTMKVAHERLRSELRISSARLEEIGPAEPPPSAVEGVADRATCVRSKVLQLPARQRQVLTLRIDPELPFSDVAAVLRITEAAAVLNFHDAARLLRVAAGGPQPVPSACARYEVLLTSRAAGALDRVESVRLEAHVASCRACSAVAAATADALGLAALAPASKKERALAEQLPSRVVAAIERSDRRRVTARRLLVAAALTAACAIVDLVVVAAALLAAGWR